AASAQHVRKPRAAPLQERQFGDILREACPDVGCQFGRGFRDRLRNASARFVCDAKGVALKQLDQPTKNPSALRVEDTATSDRNPVNKSANLAIQTKLFQRRKNISCAEPLQRGYEIAISFEILCRGTCG